MTIVRPSVSTSWTVPRPVAPQASRGWQRSYQRWLRLSDSGVVITVIVVAQAIRFGNVVGGSLAGYTSVDYLVVSTAIAGAWMVALEIYRTHSLRLIGSGFEEYSRVWAATLSIFGVIAVSSTLLRLDLARGYLAIAFPLGLVALTLNRWIARRYVSRLRRKGKCINAVLAVGQPSSVRALARSLAQHPDDGFTVVGIYSPGEVNGDKLDVALVGSIPVFSHSGPIESAVAASGADTVALTSGHLTPEEIRDLSWRLEKLDVELLLSPGVVDVAGPRLTLRPAGGSPLIHVEKPQYDGAKRFEKRAFDICFSLVVLLALSPVLLLAALAIKLTTRGPVLYLSERIGLDGKPFRMIKFRSMVVDADQQLATIAHLNDSAGVLFKIRSDPRVTPVGQFLRRYSIDELPQFINVLRREMSVVGPRPPLPSEVESYDQQVWRRLLVRPGLTGLWQISGRSDLSWEESVRLDLSYVENWSMLSDLVIAASTVRAVMRGSGAY